MRTLAIVALWILLAPDPRGSFSTAGACTSELAAWQARAKAGAQWVEAQYRAAPTAFWSSAVQRAAAQIERARSARCVEGE